MTKKTISVVIPVYNSADILDTLIQRLIQSLSESTDDFEILLVNDGSKDNSWDE